MRPGPSTNHPFNLTNNKFRSSDIIQVKLSVTVNSSFERMFGYSQSEIRSQSIKHGSKSYYALIRPDCWEQIMYAEQEASFGRTHEYMLYVTCVTKWKGEVYCLKHTKHVYDDEGRYKETRTHFIPLPDKKCPPYGSILQSSKQADKPTKTKKRHSWLLIQSINRSIVDKWPNQWLNQSFVLRDFTTHYKIKVINQSIQLTTIAVTLPLSFHWLYSLIASTNYCCSASNDFPNSDSLCQEKVQNHCFGWLNQPGHSTALCVIPILSNYQFICTLFNYMYR